MNTPAKNSLFMRFASAVADFGDPFYSEERQRDVWNEASALGFQLLLWGGLLLSTVMLWFGGGGALPYAVALLVVTGLASAMTIGYARRLGVDARARKFRSRGSSRLILLALVVAALLAGLVRSVMLSDLELAITWSTLTGLATGAVITLVLLLVLARLARRRVRGAEINDAHDGGGDSA